MPQPDTDFAGMQLTHGTAELEPGVRLHYATAGDGPRTVVLLHGYPQTWWQWRHVLPRLVAAGFRVVAIDYRGAGHSSKPPDGYDKKTMAADVRAVVRDKLALKVPLAVVGHDIGSMVAYSFALQFAGDLSHVYLAEAPLPGTKSYDTVVANLKLANNQLWHFFFHNAQNNLAEALTAGRERAYLDQFYDRLAFDPDAIDADARGRYAAAFAAPGGMRAGFELYRAFDQDAADNRGASRLRVPVLSLAGEHSDLAPIAEPMTAAVARHGTVKTIPAAGHWLAEENPAAVADALVTFLKSG